jgi:hypothetical protein
MGKRKPQTIQTIDDRSIHLEIWCDGKFTAKSAGCGETRVFPRGRQVEVETVRRWVLTHLPADPRPAADRLDAIFPATKTALGGMTLY